MDEVILKTPYSYAFSIFLSAIAQMQNKTLHEMSEGIAKQESIEKESYLFGQLSILYNTLMNTFDEVLPEEEKKYLQEQWNNIYKQHGVKNNDAD